ncbi:hypothetical protein EVAR_59758_1 [Eumeta japonica]|uniref:Uncharacterized protein n=1 Tax=Eumeta variegata TaxID=151549 RepID=A0A4C1ZQG5_EUMVA|nr:hypothetical protein EVAR_59758_1 [Eumeta japonica]
MKNLHQLNGRLTKIITPVCPIKNNVGTRCYDAPARAEAIAEYRRTMRVWRKRLGNLWPLLPLLGYLILSPVGLHKIVLRLPKRKALGPDEISTETLRQLP